MAEDVPNDVTGSVRRGVPLFVADAASSIEQSSTVPLGNRKRAVDAADLDSEGVLGDDQATSRACKRRARGTNGEPIVITPPGTAIGASSDSMIATSPLGTAPNIADLVTAAGDTAESRVSSSSHVHVDNIINSAETSAPLDVSLGHILSREQQAPRDVQVDFDTIDGMAGVIPNTPSERFPTQPHPIASAHSPVLPDRTISAVIAMEREVRARDAPPDGLPPWFARMKARLSLAHQVAFGYVPVTSTYGNEDDFQVLDATPFDVMVLISFLEEKFYEHESLHDIPL
ncbi:hypothetical protein EIP86_000606 [Pleurotus ostreatoroseus]|nr:hypothetical protein EIP86_000606 [Pleurotus ostreatoroseus]